MRVRMRAFVAFVRVPLNRFGVPRRGPTPACPARVCDVPVATANADDGKRHGGVRRQVAERVKAMEEMMSNPEVQKQMAEMQAFMQNQAMMQKMAELQVRAVRTRI